MKKTIVCMIAGLLMFCVAGKTAARAEDTMHMHADGSMSRHTADSHILMTDKGLFSVKMDIPGQRLKVGVNEFHLIVHDSSGREVTGAEINVTPWMPEMGHGVFSPPSVTEKGSGLYSVENIVIVMGGHWEFRVQVKRGQEEDNAVFDFPYVRTTDTYDYIRKKTPAGFDIVVGMKNPLEELTPEIISEEGQTIKVFHLTVKDIGFELFPDKPMMGWAFNGQIPGPTIRVTEGDRIRIVLKNKSSGNHTLHVHGQIKPPVMDGVPYIGQLPIQKGESYTYEFTVNYIGTSWYHCHVDGQHHVDMGMYGAFIVEPKEEKLQYDREYIMVLDEWPTKHIHVHENGMQMTGQDGHGMMSVHPDSPPVQEHAGETPKKRDWFPVTHLPHDEVYDGFTINGKSFPLTEPIMVKKGERVRIRFINVGYQSHFMHTHSHKFQVVARDGAYVDEPQKIDTVEVGPAKRVDIILYADNPGIWPFHCHRLNHVTNEHIYPGGMLTYIVYEDYDAEESAGADENR